jgi:hypothetical protein
MTVETHARPVTTIPPDCRGRSEEKRATQRPKKNFRKSREKTEGDYGAYQSAAARISSSSVFSRPLQAIAPLRETL